MIKAEELRIGNWVSNIHTNEDYQLTPQRWINLLRHFYPKDDCGVSMCYIKPIPLTEEWLIKLGLIKIKHHWSLNEEDLIRFYLDDKCVLHCSIGDDERGTLYRVVRYVHTLQNVCYALEEKELEINR